MKQKHKSLGPYRRWLVLAASCLINLCIGSMYAWSVFANPMAAHLSKLQGLTGPAALTSASLAIVFTVANAVGPVSMISGGFFNQKIGPRWVILFGGLIFGGGLLLSGSVSTPGMLAATYGIGCGLGMGFVYGCTITNTVKFFPDKRGFAGGIAAASYGISSVIVPPVANAMISEYGVINTFRGMGVMAIVVIGLCSTLIIPCPDQYVPEGWKPKEGSVVHTASKDKKWHEMLRDPVFYVMILILMCGAFSGLMMISQTSPMAQSMIGLTPATAAVMVSVLALFNASGRILGGFVSDKIGRINTLALVLLISIGSLVILSLCHTGSSAMFLVAVALAGLCFGGYMGIFPGFAADQFGTRYNSVNYGIMFIGFALAGVAGPQVAGRIVSSTGSYTMAFYVAMGVSMAGIALTFLYRTVNKKAAGKLQDMVTE